MIEGNPDRYRQLQEYVGWTEEDGERLRQVGLLFEGCFPGLVTDFYEAVERNPETRAVITGGAAQVERLKATLTQWLRELFTGIDDAVYVQRRWRVGYRHVEIGLEQAFTNVAFSRLRSGLNAALDNLSLPEGLARSAVRRSLNRRLDLDLAIIDDAYQTEYVLRQQRIERLAAIGQVAGGVAHEIRNPLNVIKTSVYYLLNSRGPSEEKRAEHLSRIEKQVGLANDVITALSNFARLPIPTQVSFPITELIGEVLESTDLPAGVAVQTDLPQSLPAVLADAGQIRIVLSNLIRNACDAMGGGGTLTIRGRHAEGTVRIAVGDSGHGIPAEELRAIMEPFYTTKARGIGLGLAISSSILTRNEGRLSVESSPGQGSVFTVSLKAAPAAEGTP